MISVGKIKMKKPRKTLLTSLAQPSMKYINNPNQSDSLVSSSVVSASTPHLGTKDKLAMMALKRATVRLSYIDLKRRRNTDKINHM